MNKIKERYDDITKKFLDKGCKIITTFNEFSKLEGTYKKVSIIASCSHMIDNVYIHTFLNRDSGNRCKECTKKDTKKILTVKSHDSGKIEYLAFNLLKEHLSEFIIERTVEGCLVDIIIKPKSMNNNLYLPIQLKSTMDTNFKCYSFNIMKDKYKDMIILLMCVKDNKFWILKNNDLGTKSKINIGNKSKYNEYMVDSNKLNITFMNIYENNRQLLNTKETFNIPSNIYQQREQKYRKIRETKIDFIKFTNPFIEGQVYDFLINNMKVQEKVCGIDKLKQSYICHLVKNNGMNNGNRRMLNYDVGDNDLYWINIPDENTFYIFPEKILYDRNKIGRNKQIALLIPFNQNNHWTDLYKFEYNNINKDMMLKIINICAPQYMIENKENITNETIFLDNVKNIIPQIEPVPEKILIPTKKNCPDCNIIISYKSTRCNECTVKNTIINNIKKTNRPSLEELTEDLKSLKSYINVGKKYNVSDTAIRKWIKSYNKIQ
jgi:hypothetical protein